MYNKDKIFAVIGASNNPEKFGYKVLKYLQEKGLSAIFVNVIVNLSFYI